MNTNMDRTSIRTIPIALETSTNVSIDGFHYCLLLLTELMAHGVENWSQCFGRLRELEI